MFLVTDFSNAQRWEVEMNIIILKYFIKNNTVKSYVIVIMF
jgi:hypothetical protein